MTPITKSYDLEFYTSVYMFILKGKSLYVKLALKVSMFCPTAAAGNGLNQYTAKTYTISSLGGSV